MRLWLLFLALPLLLLAGGCGLFESEPENECAVGEDTQACYCRLNPDNC